MEWFTLSSTFFEKTKKKKINNLQEEILEISIKFK